LHFFWGELDKKNTKRSFIGGSLKGRSLFKTHTPLPLDKGKGIKGIGLPDNEFKNGKGSFLLEWW